MMIYKSSSYVWQQKKHSSEEEDLNIDLVLKTMEGLLAMEELKKGYNLMLTLRDVVNEPSMDGGLVFAGEIVEQVLRSITLGISILGRGSSTDHQDPFTNGQLESNGGGYQQGIRKYTGGRRLRRYPKFERHLTEKPYDDDGYVWKKYGQKTIHGANHQRNYYRCSQHADQGCQATKQVQRSNENPKKFVVTKIGNHTCQTIFHASQLYLGDPSPTEQFTLTFRSNPSGLIFNRQQSQQHHHQIPLQQSPVDFYSSPLPNKTPVLQSPVSTLQTSKISDYSSASGYHNSASGYHNSASGYHNSTTSMEELEVLQMMHSICPMGTSDFGLQENLGLDMAAAGDFGCFGMQEVKEQETLDIDVDEDFKELVDSIGLQCW